MPGSDLLLLTLVLIRDRLIVLEGCVLDFESHKNLVSNTVSQICFDYLKEN